MTPQGPSRQDMNLHMLTGFDGANIKIEFHQASSDL